MPFDPILLKKIEENDADIVTIHHSNSLPLLNDEDIRELVNVTTKNSFLKKVLLPENKIGDKGCEYLSKLNQLEYLNLSFNEITSIGAIEISKMTHLKVLMLNNNFIDDAGLKSILQNLTKLESLIINGNKITEDSIKLILSHPNLKITSFDEDKISNELINKITLHLEQNSKSTLVVHPLPHQALGINSANFFKDTDSKLKRKNNDLSEEIEKRKKIILTIIMEQLEELNYENKENFKNELLDSIKNIPLNPIFTNKK